MFIFLSFSFHFLSFSFHSLSFPVISRLDKWCLWNVLGMPFVLLAAYGGHGHGGKDEAKSTAQLPVWHGDQIRASSELKACLASGESRIGGGLQPLYLLFLLGSLWDHIAPGVPHQGPWCTSPGQWLSWPKGDGVKCSRSEGPRRESRSRGRSSLLVGWSFRIETSLSTNV